MAQLCQVKGTALVVAMAAADALDCYLSYVDDATPLVFVQQNPFNLGSKRYDFYEAAKTATTLTAFKVNTSVYVQMRAKMWQRMIRPTGTLVTRGPRVAGAVVAAPVAAAPVMGPAAHDDDASDSDCPSTCPCSHDDGDEPEEDEEGRAEDEAQGEADVETQAEAEQRDVAPPKDVPVYALASAVTQLPVFTVSKRSLLHMAAEEPDDLYPIVNKKKKLDLLNVFFVRLERLNGPIIVTMELLADENTERLYIAVANKLPHKHFKLFEKSTGNLLGHSEVSKGRAGTYLAVSMPDVNMMYHFRLLHKASDGKLTRRCFEIEQPYGTDLICAIGDLESVLSTVSVNGVAVNVATLCYTLPEGMKSNFAPPPALESIRGLCTVQGCIS